MKENLNEQPHLSRRKFVEIMTAVLISAGVPVTIKAVETAGSYFLGLQYAQLRAKQLKRRTSFKRMRPRHFKEEINYRRLKEQKLTEPASVEADIEPAAPEGQGTDRSEDSKASLTTFILDTRPPEPLRGFADRSYLTMDGRRRWKQQEWLPLRVEDLPEFDGEHSREAYTRIIDYFNVGDPLNERYAAVGGTTFCNIFIWDVTRAMDVEIPRWIDGEKTWTNSIYEWLTDSDQGGYLGWERVVLPFTAQEEANKGYPAVVMTVPKNGRFGHMAMVIPGDGEVFRGEYSPMSAQAGLTNFVGRSVYSSSQFRDREIAYFANTTSGYRFALPGETGS